MRPSFRRQSSTRSAQETQEIRLHRSYARLYESLQEASLTDSVFAPNVSESRLESLVPKILRRAALHLKLHGVAHDFVEYDGQPALQIRASGDAPLNVLAAGIARNHFGARLLFSPYTNIKEKSFGLHDAADMVVCLPASIVMRPHDLQAEWDTTLGHELIHLKGSSDLRRRRPGYRYTSFKESFSICEREDDGHISGDEERTARGDLERLIDRYEGRHHKSGPYPSRQVVTVLKSAKASYGRACLSIASCTESTMEALREGKALVRFARHPFAPVSCAFIHFFDSRRNIIQATVPLPESEGPGSPDNPRQLCESLCALHRDTMQGLREASGMFFRGEQFIRNPLSDAAWAEMADFYRLSLPPLKPAAEFLHWNSEDPASRAEILSKISRLQGKSQTHAMAALFVAEPEEGTAVEPAEKKVFERALRYLATRHRVNADLLKYVGNELRDRGQHDFALRAFEALLRIQPDSAGVCNDVALCLLSLGRDPARAVELSKRAVRGSPDVAAFYDTLGVALFNSGSREQARLIFAQGYELAKKPACHPCDRLELLLHYCEVLFAGGRMHKAKSVLDSAEALIQRHKLRENEAYAPMHEELLEQVRRLCADKEVAPLIKNESGLPRAGEASRAEARAVGSF